MSGLLGALGGLGQGMSQVGEQWAQDLKTKRIEELRHTREIAKELRGEKRELAKEGRQREYKAEDRDADLEAKKALERFKADTARSEEGRKPTESLRKYMEMREMGSSHEEAFASSYGNYLTMTDPVFGGSQIVGKGNWEVLAETDVERNAEGKATGLSFGPKKAEPPPEGSIVRNRTNGKYYVVRNGEPVEIPDEDLGRIGVR